LKLFLTTFKGADASAPFGPDSLVYKVMGKMFALVSQTDTPSRVTLKCDPEQGELLVSHYDCVVPGYYMNKKHWITVSLTDEIADDAIEDLALTSYELVVKGLRKADREALMS
jgi:predicted DNA-binding protein (MmcQ/YjbR family)